MNRNRKVRKMTRHPRWFVLIGTLCAGWLSGPALAQIRPNRALRPPATLGRPAPGAPHPARLPPMRFARPALPARVNVPMLSYHGVALPASVTTATLGYVGFVIPGSVSTAALAYVGTPVPASVSTPTLNYVGAGRPMKLNLLH